MNAMKNEIDINELREMLSNFLTLDQTERDALMANLLNWLLERVAALEGRMIRVGADVGRLNESVFQAWRKEQAQIELAQQQACTEAWADRLSYDPRADSNRLTRFVHQLMREASAMSRAISQDTVYDINDLCEEIERELAAQATRLT